MRASIAAEAAGYPTVSLVCEGFQSQARATGEGAGYSILALGVTTQHVDAQTAAEMERDFVAHTVQQVVAGLATTIDLVASDDPQSPADDTTVGTIDEINAVFIDNGWSDGLPIIPPTADRVNAFIQAAGADPADYIGIAKSSGRDITVWSVAVNAVMTGCLPRHMPVLLAAAEILADPGYGAEHSGNTTGADALMIVSGPSSRDLGFNDEQGALREGTHANTCVGRWLRLFLRNVFDFTADQHDKATFGNSARVVLAEHHQTLTELGWPTIGAQLGYDSNDDVVSMARMNSGLIIGSVFGSSPDEILPYLADGLARASGWDLTHVYGLGQGHFRPLLILSPILARIFGDAGWSKADVAAALFEQARIPAWRFEKLIGEWSNLTAGRRTLLELAAAGHVPAEFAATDDPERLVPIVTSPECFMIAVAGDPNRTNAYVMSHDGPHGDWTARRYEPTAIDPAPT